MRAKEEGGRRKEKRSGSSPATAVPAMRVAHGAPHRQIRQNPRLAVLGLHELPRMQRHSQDLTDLADPTDLNILCPPNRSFQKSGDSARRCATTASATATIWSSDRLHRLLPSRQPACPQRNLAPGEEPRRSLAEIQLRGNQRPRQNQPRPLLAQRQQPRRPRQPARPERPRGGHRREHRSRTRKFPCRPRCPWKINADFLHVSRRLFSGV